MSFGIKILYHWPYKNHKCRRYFKITCRFLNFLCKLQIKFNWNLKLQIYKKSDFFLFYQTFHTTTNKLILKATNNVQDSNFNAKSIFTSSILDLPPKILDFLIRKIVFFRKSFPIYIKNEKLNTVLQEEREWEGRTTTDDNRVLI